MPRVAWELYDPIADETYLLHINPDAGGSPTRRKTLSTRTTTAGKALYFQGSPEPRTFEASGTMLSEAHYNELDRWVEEKNHQVRLTDDLGRVFWIYLVALVPSRVRKGSHPWFHTYSLEYTELDNA